MLNRPVLHPISLIIGRNFCDFGCQVGSTTLSLKPPLTTQVAWLAVLVGFSNGMRVTLVKDTTESVFGNSH